MATLFKSFFKAGVEVIDPFTNPNWIKQRIKGKDGGYNWQDDFPVGKPELGDDYNPIFGFSIPVGETLSDYASVQIVDGLNPRGTTAKLLELKVKAYSADNFGRRANGRVRVQHSAYNPDDAMIVEQYIRYPNLDDLMEDGDWFSPMEWKLPGTGRWVLLIKKTTNGKSFWRLIQETLPTHDNLERFDSDTFTLPTTWFKLSAYFRIGASGQVIVKVNDKTIFNFKGRTLPSIQAYDLQKVYCAARVIDNGEPYALYSAVNIERT